MAQYKLTAKEFITNAFSPQIGAVCSEAAEAICQKNHLSFIELLQPFCNLTNEGTMKDPQGTIIVVRNIRLSIQDIYSQPVTPTAARKLLNDCVTSEQSDRSRIVTVGKMNVNIPTSVSWYETWRQMFLKIQPPSDHEFTKHYLACMIVVCTSEENPLEKIRRMAAQLHQQSTSSRFPKWFNNNALRYYVLLRDASQEDSAKIESMFAEIKTLYGANNCFLLQMNSRPPGQQAVDGTNVHLPDPWSQFLIRETDSVNGDNSSSPRTPADTGGVSSMPNKVTNEHARTSNAGTPVSSQIRNQNPILLSPDIVDEISLSSEMSHISSHTIPVEMGQEAVPVNVHPLSPEVEEKLINLNIEVEGPYNSNTKMKSSNNSSPMNVNVWADSPSGSTTAIQHGSQLSTQDLDRIKKLINEFYLKSLLPYVEKQIGILNDVISNKKGVSRSLFSATKRWFGTNKPGVPISSSSTSSSSSSSLSSSSLSSNAVVYTAECPELQLRRLGDLSFMFGHYSLAYQAYHSAKRDFAADQAWLYYAGALEMAGLSAFMQGEMTRKTIEYMDDAILTYSNSCKIPQLATRATLLSSECLKDKNLYGEAAKQLIRMTSEDSDLRSALLLEQAAYCFIATQMIHKYAFHAVLSGHRYSKAGQRKHSLRCYQQAYEIYNKRGWSLAEDHIHFTIGRQMASLKQVNNAAEAFGKLLNPLSKQPGPQQAAFLGEFLHIHRLILQESLNFSQLPILPLPLIQANEIKVLLGPFIIGDNSNEFDHFDDSDDLNWAKLEESLINQIQGSTSMIFKPTISLYTNKTNNNQRPNAVVDEPIYFSVELENPLRINIPLSKVKLIWFFHTRDGEEFTNENLVTENSLLETTLSVETTMIDTIILQPLSKQRVILSCVPTQVGDLNVIGMSYNLLNPTNGIDDPIVNPTVVIHGKTLFNIRGPRLNSSSYNNNNSKNNSSSSNSNNNNNNAKEKTNVGSSAGTGINVLYGLDQRLNINIVDKAPFMVLSFTKIPLEVLAGEIQRLDVTLKNIGNSPLKNVYVISMNPELFFFQNNPFVNDTKLCSKAIKVSLSPSLDNEITNINVNESRTIPLWIRAPYQKGNHRLDLLFYYENCATTSTLKYRLTRHTWQLTVLESMHFKALARPSRALTSTINLVIQVKNSNQVHDPFMHDIQMTRLFLDNYLSWHLSLQSPITSSTYCIQPQEIYHLLIKLYRSHGDDKTWASQNVVSLTSNLDNEEISSIYSNLAKKQQLKLNTNDNNESHIMRGGVKQLIKLVDPGKLNVNMIITWKAKIMEGTTIVRRAIGYHYIKIQYLNKLYKYPADMKQKLEYSDYSSNLKFFGSAINVSSHVANFNPSPSNQHIEKLKNLLCLSMSHKRNISHSFEKNQVCVIAVLLNLQNNSHFDIDVKINTIGTNSQESSANIKSQLYSPQASTFFRYACHSAIKCRIKANESQTVQLSAIVSDAGSYDLASRLKFSLKTSDSETFVVQKWTTESLCIVINSKF